MKIKSTNSETVRSIVNPEDKPRTAEKITTSQTPTGLGSVKSKFEIAQSPTTLDKMIEGKILQPDPSDRDIRMAPSPESKYYGWSTKFRESAGKVRENSVGLEQQPNQKLRPDQFSVNAEGKVVVQQNQAETLKAQSANDQTPSESHIWMNAATKRSSTKSPEVEAFVIDGAVKFAANNPEARAIVEPEDAPIRKPLTGIVTSQIIEPQDLPAVDQGVAPEDLPPDYQSKVREDGSVRFSSKTVAQGVEPEDKPAVDQIIDPQNLPASKEPVDDEYPLKK